MSYDPEKQRQESQTRMLRVMVMAALADGEVDSAERAEIKKQYMELSGFPIPAEMLNSEIAMATSSGADLNTFVGSFAHELSPHGRALIVKLAFHTMSATGDLQPGHQSQLSKLAQTLRIPQDQYMELITHLSSPTSEEHV